MHHLYRHYDENGSLLYVGESVDAIHRLAGHKSEAAWYDLIRTVKIAVFASKAMAIEAETEAIRNEKPLHNIKMREKGLAYVDRDRNNLIAEASALDINLDLRRSTPSIRSIVEAHPLIGEFRSKIAFDILDYLIANTPTDPASIDALHEGMRAGLELCLNRENTRAARSQ